MSRFASDSDASSPTNAQRPVHGAHGQHRGYDPNQPRVPAGHSDGGEWAKKPGGGSPSAPRREAIVDRTGKESWGSYVNTYRPDGSLAEQRVFNRDGSRIVSEFNTPNGPGDWDERHTVVMRDGRTATFENSGDVQRIYDRDGRLLSASEWTKDGPEALPTVQQAFLPALAPLVPPTVATIELGLVLFTWLATRNLVDSVPVLSVPSWVFRPDAEDKSRTVFAGRVENEKLKDACPRYDDVQRFTDNAARATKRANFRNAAEYGTAVHSEVQDAVEKDTKGDLSAEVSLLKTLEETGEPPKQPEKEPGERQKTRWGKKGSLRIDVLENTKNGMVCVYDIKTGKRGLSARRTAEIARAVYLRYPGASGFIITEMRPH